MSEASIRTKDSPWWKGVTRYQWLVLLIASLGWIFDIFEGQIFVTSMNEMMASLLPPDVPADKRDAVTKIALGVFLVGGAVGGVFFGMLSDRIGRARTMVITILVYSIFTCMTAFAQEAWQVIVLRFFVAMGIGGEWAVASAMVAEVFPKWARVRSLGIFHATSTLGSYLAIAAGAFIVGNPALNTEAIPDLNWRLAFGIGVLPALLTIWIRVKLKEPESWKKAREIAKTDPTKRTGRIGDLFKGELRRRTLVGVALAAIGLATFWGVKIYGRNLMRSAAEREVISQQSKSFQGEEAALEANFSEIKKTEMKGHFLVMTGGLLGMLAFGPISERIGRRGAFSFFFIGGFASSALLFGLFTDMSIGFYWWALPVFGFLVSGIHAGYAIYFPELFPSRLRGTGGGLCFNLGRIIAAPVLFLTAWMQGSMGFTTNQTAAWLSVFFLLGLIIVRYAPETQGEDLPE